MGLEFNKKDIGNRIRKLRADKGLTQEEFCKKNNLKTAGNLSAIEKGRAYPTIDTILYICKFSGVSSDFLLFGKPDERYIEHKEKHQKAQNTLKQVLEHYRSMIQSAEFRLKAEIESEEMELKSLEISWEAYKAGHFKFDQADGPNQLHQRMKSNKFIIDTQQRELQRIEQLSATLDSDLKSIEETFL